MGPKPTKKEMTEVAYERLPTGDARALKGYVPVLVGKEPSTERFLVHVKLFSDPCMAVLLDMAEDELGRRQDGVLRVLCSVEYFRHVVGVISRAK